MLASVHRSSTASVAVLAHEPSDVSLVASLLRHSGFEAEFQDFTDVKQLETSETFAVVMCHRMSANSDYNTVADKLEASRLIVLSDCTSESTIVNLLESGARHVFDIHEQQTVLQARLEAALRQHHGMVNDTFSIDDIHFDIQKRKVTRGGQTIDLSPKEFEFATRIFVNVDQVVKNSELMTSVWSLPQHMDTRRIDTAACRVRKKMRLFRDDGWLLKRIRCVGYRLTRADTETMPD